MSCSGAYPASSAARLMSASAGALLDGQVRVGEHLPHGGGDLAQGNALAAAQVVDAVREVVRGLKKLDALGYVLHVAEVTPFIFGEGNAAGIVAEVRRRALDGSVAVAAGQVEHTVVQGSVDAADAHGDDVHLGPVRVVQGQDLEALLECFGGVGGGDREGSVLSKGTFPEAPIHGLGAGYEHPADAAHPARLQDVDEAVQVEVELGVGGEGAEARGHKVDDVRDRVLEHDVQDLRAPSHVGAFDLQPLTDIVPEYLRLPARAVLSNDHVVASVQELPSGVHADETHATRYEDHAITPRGEVVRLGKALIRPTP